MRNLKNWLMERQKRILIFVVWLILSAASVAYAKDVIKSVVSLTVIDANGKHVGTVISNRDRGAPRIAFEVNKSAYLLNVKLNRLEGTTELSFDNVNCMGNAYLSPSEPDETVVPYVAISPPGHTLFVPDPNSGPQMVIIQSSYSSESDQCNSTGPSSPRSLLPAIPVIDFDDVFTPPFKLNAAKTKAMKIPK